MKLLLIVFYFLEFANCQEAQEPIQGTVFIMLVTIILTQNKLGNCNNNNVGDLRLVHNSGGNFGAIQVCQDIPGSHNDQWRYFSSNGAWTDRAARLACRQLNLGYLSKRLAIGYKNIYIRYSNLYNYFVRCYNKYYGIN